MDSQQPEKDTPVPLLGSGLPKKNRIPKRAVYFLSILLAVFFVCGGVYWRQRVHRPALVVGTTTISRAQYNSLIDQASKAKIAKNDATNTIVDIEKKIIVAQKIGITIDQRSIETAAIAKYGVYKTAKLNDWQMLNAKGAVIDNALLLQQNDNYDATAYYFPYSRYFGQTIPASKDPKFGDRAAVEDDKAYALAQAESYRQKLMANSLSPTAALAQIITDKRLDYGFAKNDSGKFMFDSNGRIFVQGSSVTQQVPDELLQTAKGTKTGDYSDIQTSKINISLSPLPEYKGKDIPVAYYFIKSNNSAKSNSDLQKQFDATIKTIKVERNV